MPKTNATAAVATKTAKATRKTKAIQADSLAAIGAVLAGANPDAEADKLLDKHALTPEAKARKRKSAANNAKSPKSSAQTALASKPKIEMGEEPRYTPSRTVLTCKPVTTGADAMVVSIGAKEGETIIVPKHLFVGKVAEAAKVGESWADFKATWEAAKKERTGKLAAGLDGRNSPHAAKSVADGRQRSTNKADAATQKPAAKPATTKAPAKAKKEERKAAREASAAPKADDTRKITIVDKKFTYGKEGSARNASWLACTKAKTVADYAKAGGAVKYLPRWVAAGAIKLG